MLNLHTACQLGILIAGLSSVLYPVITTIAALTALFTRDPSRRRVAQQILKTQLAGTARHAFRRRQSSRTDLRRLPPAVVTEDVQAR